MQIDSKRQKSGKQAKSALHHTQTVDHIQQGRGKLGLQGNPSEQRKLVVLEVQHQEEATRLAKVVTQVWQGQRMK